MKHAVRLSGLGLIVAFCAAGCGAPGVFHEDSFGRTNDLNALMSFSARTAKERAVTPMVENPVNQDTRLNKRLDGMKKRPSKPDTTWLTAPAAPASGDVLNKDKRLVWVRSRLKRNDGASLQAPNGRKLGAFAGDLSFNAGPAAHDEIHIYGAPEMMDRDMAAFVFRNMVEMKVDPASGRPRYNIKSSSPGATPVIEQNK